MVDRARARGCRWRAADTKRLGGMGWLVLLMRVWLPNRPGALGAVATALGSIGADISLVEIVEKRAGIEVDELILSLPETVAVESIVSVCDHLDGVQVEWIRNYPRGGGIEFDVALMRRMASAADLRGAAEQLVTAAPLVFRAHWSVLVDVARGQVVFGTETAPDLDRDQLERFRPFDTTHRTALEHGWLPGWAQHHAMVAPYATVYAVLVGRRGEPPFFGSELARINHLAGVTEEPAADPSAPTGLRPGGHRRPVAAPLYVRRAGA